VGEEKREINERSKITSKYNNNNKNTLLGLSHNYLS